ncbi:MAG TPA: nucleotide-binding protein [Methanoregula sp.]|jgi:hypothetical protein|nr:nucleotide-binding protein [Methanoregula sp.]
MKIGTIDVKVSYISIGVFVFFTLLLILASLGDPGMRQNLFWMIPSLFLLLVIPVLLNYMSRSQYKDLEPVYEKEAKPVRVRLINESMIGKIVRIEGVVERVHFQFLNRPQYTVADRSGAISVKMFTTPPEDVKVNDVVEVFGQVIRRYMLTGEPVINCVIIRKNNRP